MFNIKKIIEKIKREANFKKPFNLRKKANDDDWYYGDEDETEDDFGSGFTEVDPEVAPEAYPEEMYPEDQGFYSTTTKMVSPEELIEANQVMESWIQENKNDLEQVGSQPLEVLNQVFLDDSQNVPVPEGKQVADLLSNNKEFMDILSNKLSSEVTSIDQPKADIFVKTMLAKRNQEEYERQRRLEEEAEAKKNKGKERDYIYEQVAEKFDPSKLRGEEREKVLNALSPGGAGRLYDPTSFSYAVEKRFSAPEGGNLDQRMNFFLNNPEALSLEIFPEGNIFNAVPNLEGELRKKLSEFGIENPDLGEALKTAANQKAMNTPQGHIPSPKKPIADFLKRQAGDKLLQILSHLIQQTDPSIVEWLKPALGRGDVVQKSKGEVSLENTGGDDISIGNIGVSGKTPFREDQEITSEEETAAGKQIAAVVDYYLSDQLEVMDNMKDSVSVDLMTEQTNDFMTLEKEYKVNPNEETLNKLQKKSDSYSQVEVLNAYTKRAIDQINVLFKEASSKGIAERYKEEGGKAKSTAFKINNESGQQILNEEVVRDIFFGRKKNIAGNNPYEYVESYKEQVNKGIEKDPYDPEWSKMVNRNVPYNAFADVYSIKSTINELYEQSQKRLMQTGIPSDFINRREQIDLIYKEIYKDPEKRKLLQEFSGVTSSDINNSAAVMSKERNFINMTLYQQKFKKMIEEREGEEVKFPFEVYKACFDAREKYKDIRENIENNPSLSEKEKQKYILRANRSEKEGDFRFKRNPDYDPEDPKSNLFVIDKKTGKPKITKSFSVLKNIKGHVARSSWPLFPKILDNIRSSDKDDYFKKNAKRSFIELYNHEPSSYNKFEYIGQEANPFDEKGRSNTELFYEITKGRVPDEIEQMMKIKEVAKSRKKDSGENRKKMTGFERKIVHRIQKVMEKKKDLDRQKDLMESSNAIRNNYINYFLNYKARKVRDEILFEKNPNKVEKMLSHIPEKEREKFKKEVIQGWDGSSILDNEDYLRLGLKGPVKKKTNLDEKFENYAKKVADIEEDIGTLKGGGMSDKGEKVIGLDKLMEEYEEKIREERIKEEKKREKDTTTSSHVRMLCAEYKNMMSKINQLENIKKFSHKFASVGDIRIDDKIKEIEHNFSNLLKKIIE